MAPKKSAKRDGFRPYLPIVISCLALVVAVSSTAISFLSFRQSREFSEIAIKPILHTAGPLFLAPASKIVIVNRGAGSAIVSSGRFAIDNQQIRGREISMEYDKYQTLYNATHGTNFSCTLKVGSIYHEMLIEAGQQVILFSSTGECPDTMYMPFFSRVSFVIEYRSLTGLTEVMRFEARSPEEGDKLVPLL